MIFYIFCFILLLLLLVVIKSVIMPYRLFRWYKKLLKNSNYKVFAIDFFPFGFRPIFSLMEDLMKHKDYGTYNPVERKRWDNPKILSSNKKFIKYFSSNFPGKNMLEKPSQTIFFLKFKLFFKSTKI